MIYVYEYANIMVVNHIIIPEIMTHWCSVQKQLDTYFVTNIDRYIVSYLHGYTLNYVIVFILTLIVLPRYLSFLCKSSYMNVAIDICKNFRAGCI